MIRIFYQIIDDRRPHYMPKKAYDTDAGWDLFTCQEASIPPGEMLSIPTNFKFAIPGGWCGFVMHRTSTFRKTGLIVHPTLLDSGFRGEVKITVYNALPEPVVVPEGAHPAQLIIIPVPDVKWVCAQKLDKIAPSVRGTRGFGSTGL
jgi:dUTP pyrophosphatase